MKKKRYFLVDMLVLFIASIFIIASTRPSFAAGTHKNYFLKTTVDYGGFGLQYDIVKDDAKNGTASYAEEEGGYTYSKISNYANVVMNKSLSTVNSNSKFLIADFHTDRSGDAAENAAKYDEFIKEKDGEGSGEMNGSLVFSFPGLKGVSSPATSQDYTRASLVGETLVGDLNKAIVFINNNCNTDLVSGHSLRLILAKLSYTSKFESSGSYKFVVGEGRKSTTVTVSVATKSDAGNLIPISGLNYSDYVKISCDKDDEGGKPRYSYFAWRMPKGYHSDQPLYSNLNATAKGLVEGDNGEPSHLTWGQLILQAMVNEECIGTTQQDFANDVQTLIGQGLGSDLSKTIGSVRNMLGLSTMSELVLNMGARPLNYHYGVMTNDMHDIAITVYTVNLILSLLFLGFMIVKLIHQKMVATTNIIAKTNLMEGIKDIVFVCVMLAFFTPLFEILLELNYLIVRTFSYSSDYMSAFSILGSTALSMESMAGFIISTMFLSIDMYINFVYLVREITVSFMFAIAPIIIVSYLWSPTQKNMVFGYIRELVGNIFMQSFHAITMTFFAGYNMSNMTSLQAIGSAYCFIPITQLFRQLVIGNNGGFSEKVGGKLAGQVANMSTGMQKAGLNYRQSKEMFTAQQKANYDIQKGQFDAQLQSGGIQGLGQVLGGAASGLGGDLPGISALTNSVGKGFEVLGSLAGMKVGGEKALETTKSAYEQLGSVHSKQADETLGMGLTELGIGLGVESFDSAGDRMVQNGLATFQKGAISKGTGESMQGDGGDYMAQSNKYRAMQFPLMSATHAAGAAGAALAGAGGKVAADKYNEHKSQKLADGEVARDYFPGFDGLESRHIHDVRNFDEKKGQFELISKVKLEDLTKENIGKDSNLGKIADVYDTFKNRENDVDSMRKWKEMSRETGIKEISINHNGNLEFLMDARRSGFTGRQMKSKDEVKHFIFNDENARRQL